MQILKNMEERKPNIYFSARPGWVGQEGDRKRKEMELLRNLEPGHDPNSPPPPPPGEKYVFIGIAAGLVAGGVIGLLLGLSIDWLKPILWILIIGIAGGILGGFMGNYFKKKADRKRMPDPGRRGAN
jgi:hypothetical protein